MKRNRFSVEQIVAMLKQAEAGMPVAELIRHVVISEQTFYRWIFGITTFVRGINSDSNRFSN